MSKDVETILPEASLVAGVKKMRTRRIRRLMVTKNEDVVGVVCHRDLADAFPSDLNPYSVLALEEAAFRGTIADVMKSPVIAIERDQPIEHAAKLMSQYHIGGLPVTQKGKLVGVITESDIFRALSELLSDKDGSARITFDLTESEDVLLFLVETTRKLDLTLTSVLTFHDKGRRMAVVRVRGSNISDLIDKLWDSNHAVVNVLRGNKSY